MRSYTYLILALTVLIYGCDNGGSSSPGTTSGSSGNFPAQVESPDPVDSSTNVAVTKQLAWTSSADATSYNVYFGTANPPTYQLNTITTIYNPGALSCNTTYYWRIDPKNTSGATAGNIWSFSTGLLSAPIGVLATAGPTQVTVSWNSVAGATSYNIYWSTAPGVNKSTGTKITGATSPCIHTGRTNGITYYYVVTSLNGASESSESTQVSATPVFNLTLVGTCGTTEAKGIYVVGNYAYVADGTAGLKIINISNPAAPALTGSYDTTDAKGVCVTGNYAYVADGISGLEIINISNPAAPALTGSYNTPGSAYAVHVSGSYAYVADYNGGLQIINISNPAAPTFTGSYSTTDAEGIYVLGNYAYVSDYISKTLYIINISTPTAPALTGSCSLLSYACGVYVAGNYAYVTVDTSGLQIIDVSTPATPASIGSNNTTGLATGVHVSGSYAYVADYGSGLQAINISNPAVPTFAGSYNTTGLAYGIFIVSNYAYVADGGSGLRVIRIW